MFWEWYFIDVETEAQGEWVTCPELPSQVMAEQVWLYPLWLVLYLHPEPKSTVTSVTNLLGSQHKCDTHMHFTFTLCTLASGRSRSPITGVQYPSDANCTATWDCTALLLREFELRYSLVKDSCRPQLPSTGSLIWCSRFLPDTADVLVSTLLSNLDE